MKQSTLIVGVCAVIWFIFLPLFGEALLFSPAPGRALLEIGVLAFAGIFIVWGLMRVQGGSMPISSQPDEQEVDHWFLAYLRGFVKLFQRADIHGIPQDFHSFAQ